MIESIPNQWLVKCHKLFLCATALPCVMVSSARSDARVFACLADALEMIGWLKSIHGLEWIAVCECEPGRIETAGAPVVPVGVDWVRS